MQGWGKSMGAPPDRWWEFPVMTAIFVAYIAVEFVPVFYFLETGQKGLAGLWFVGFPLVLWAIGCNALRRATRRKFLGIF